MASSSHYDNNYDRKNVMDSIQVEAGKGKYNKKITLLDKLDYRYLDVIKNCTLLTIYVWKNGDNLPNLAYKYYGTTTPWWIIARFNGIIDVLNIKAGDKIGIPNIRDIGPIMNKLSNTKNYTEQDSGQLYFKA